MTKEECIKALKTLHTMAWFETKDKNYVDENYSILVRLINQHFDNPPLKFEELKEGQWVWDNMNKAYLQIDEDFDVGNNNIILRYREDSHNSNVESVPFEENRFYRYEVKENVDS